MFRMQIMVSWCLCDDGPIDGGHWLVSMIAKVIHLQRKKTL